MSETREQMAARLEHVSELPMFVPEAVAALRAGAQALREPALPLAPTPPETKTLRDYRPQHADDCAGYQCAECGAHRSDSFAHGFGKPCDDFTPHSCSCGLADLLSSPAPGAVETPEGWQPIETAPKMRTVLMFAVTNIGDDGRVNNWKMATGHLTEGRAARDNETDVSWDGHQLKVYDHQPTHWMPLPAPPALRSGGSR
jgi:hypothetical protein